VRFQIGNPFASSPDEQQRINQDLLNAVNAVGVFIYTGAGAPTVTPTGPAIYFRQNPSAGAAVYLFNGTTWTAVV
jgi:hypothetical protein